MRLKAISTIWSPQLAYAIGLIASDGCLSRDGRHIDFTSKDLDQIHNFQECLNTNVKIGKKLSGYKNHIPYYRIQLTDSNFHSFLYSIGIMPAKSKILSNIKIPDQYFFDFLRGCLDGDGYSYSYFDKRWKSSFMFYIGFCSVKLSFYLLVYTIEFIRI